MLVLRVLFFFVQKSEYEIRINDWRSSVCSSDLADRPALCISIAICYSRICRGLADRQQNSRRAPRHPRKRVSAHSVDRLRQTAQDVKESGLPARRSRQHLYAHQKRSEEHTSELQSLMRISYAVFCLKKKHK